MNLDDLLGIGDVVPVPVGLPAFRDNLNENTSRRRLGNMGNTLHVGLDVEFRLFIFDQSIFLCLEIYAGIFNRLVGVAAGDFDREAGNGSGRRRLLWRRGLLRARGGASREENQNKTSQSREPGKLHGSFLSMLAGNGAGVKFVEELGKWP